MTTTITPGTIFVSTWGYDQTNVDFYKVVRSTAASVWLQKVGQRVVEQTGYMSETVMPTDHEIGNVFRRKVSTFMGKAYASVNDYAGASEWNGQPITQTHYA
jgi:hypothetical protein